MVVIGVCSRMLNSGWNAEAMSEAPHNRIPQRSIIVIYLSNDYDDGRARAKGGLALAAWHDCTCGLGCPGRTQCRRA